jgi:hypothetical protein
LTQNETNSIITTFLQQNEPFLTRARAILYQIATPNAELLNFNAGSLNNNCRKQEDFQLSENNALENNSILGICGVLLKRTA